MEAREGCYPNDPLRISQAISEASSAVIAHAKAVAFRYIASTLLLYRPGRTLQSWKAENPENHGNRVCHLILAPMRQASDRGTELRIDRRGERRPSGDGAPSYESTAAANDGLDLLGVEADFVGGGSVPRSLACPVNAKIKWHTRQEDCKVRSE